MQIGECLLCLRLRILPGNQDFDRSHNTMKIFVQLDEVALRLEPGKFCKAIVQSCWNSTRSITFPIRKKLYARKNVKQPVYQMSEHMQNDI